jgi:hypothetical protein
MSAIKSIGVLVLCAGLASCGFPSDLGDTAAALHGLADAGSAFQATPGDCVAQPVDPLMAIALGEAQPQEAAWFVPAGQLDVPSIGPGVTDLEHALGDGWWLWLSFGEPPSDGVLPRDLGRPSCARDDARLFAVASPDGGGRFLERPMHARVHVVDAGIEAGDALDLELTEVSYDDPRGAIALPDIHVQVTLMPWSPGWEDSDGGP